MPTPSSGTQPPGGQGPARCHCCARRGQNRAWHPKTVRLYLFPGQNQRPKPTCERATSTGTGAHEVSLCQRLRGLASPHRQGGSWTTSQKLSLMAQEAPSHRSHRMRPLRHSHTHRDGRAHRRNRVRNRKPPWANRDD